MLDSGGSKARRRWQAAAATGLTVAAGAAFAWPALVNGHPLLSNDAAVFINNAGSGRFHAGRAIGYPLFLRGVTLQWSLWLAVIVQGLLTAALLGRVAWLFARARRVGTGACAFAALLLLTGAGKYVSSIMADVFTSWLLLAPLLWLLAAGAADRTAAGLALVLAILVHNSHLPIALAGTGVMLGALLLARRAGLPGAGAGLGSAALLGLVVAASVPVGLGLNAAFAERSSVLNGTPALLTHRFVESGVATQALDRYCPERSWGLCEHREAIRAAAVPGEDWFLFDPASPFQRMGGWNDAELEDFVEHAFRCCLDRIVWTTLDAAARQFMTIDSADGLEEPRSRGAVRAIGTWMPRDLAAARASDQMSARPLRVRALPIPERLLHAVFLVAALALAGLALRSRDWRAFALLAGTLLFLTLNALVTAFASTVHGRYQGRVAWLLPYAVVLVASQRPAVGPEAPAR